MPRRCQHRYIRQHLWGALGAAAVCVCGGGECSILAFPFVVMQQLLEALLPACFFPLTGTQREKERGRTSTLPLLPLLRLPGHLPACRFRPGRLAKGSVSLGLPAWQLAQNSDIIRDIQHLARMRLCLHAWGQRTGNNTVLSLSCDHTATTGEPLIAGTAS